MVGLLLSLYTNIRHNLQLFHYDMYTLNDPNNPIAPFAQLYSSLTWSQYLIDLTLAWQENKLQCELASIHNCMYSFQESRESRSYTELLIQAVGNVY